MSNATSPLVLKQHASALYDFESAETAEASFSKAIHDLAARAALSGGTVAWSTLDIDVEVSTVSDSRITEKYERVSVGRSTITVSADVIIGSARD